MMMKNADLLRGDILIGEIGGLSFVIAVQDSASANGSIAVQTEHGWLYKKPDGMTKIIREESE